MPIRTERRTLPPRIRTGREADLGRSPAHHSIPVDDEQAPGQRGEMAFAGSNTGRHSFVWRPGVAAPEKINPHEFEEHLALDHSGGGPVCFYFSLRTVSSPPGNWSHLSVAGVERQSGEDRANPPGGPVGNPRGSHQRKLATGATGDLSRAKHECAEFSRRAAATHGGAPDFRR